ncbi:MAG: class I SAM-dependent methyltransferase [Paracoccaceae bacterium]
MKSLLLVVASAIGWIWRMVPASLRTSFLTGLFVLDSRSPAPENGLRRLLILKDKLEWVINERAMAYEGNEHPKHRLMRYHQFFVDRIENGERVLDVGCGYGAVARSIARERPRCVVTGMDMNEPRLAQARATESPPNLSYVEGDATREVPPGGWDVIVLSNVLEHVTDRIDFLRGLQSASGAPRILIRVPLFERDWQMPLRRELGVNYFSDDDHKIEHRLEELYAELAEANLQAVETLTLWGEIWADCRRR